jgi:hypothetical protein
MFLIYCARCDSKFWSVDAKVRDDEEYWCPICGACVIPGQFGFRHPANKAITQERAFEIIQEIGLRGFKRLFPEMRPPIAIGNGHMQFIRY